ncbi:sphingomyelin phosphodiesterase-like [Pollicipes pollicipes]|uniref:sphingomyelin phosphodiesterase-like n=1 Tax=Pollicipes pollicipes TaxID=41117 RepID=UPI0018851748|nr:sphingomyelin phosphodiesterase-like [Pollicipes pollicipes]
MVETGGVLAPLIAITIAAAAAAASPQMDYRRLVQAARTSYETGEPHPYLQRALDALDVRHIHHVLRTRPGGIPRWSPADQDTLCNTCAFFVGNILNEFYSGVPVDEIEEQAAQICITFKLYPEEVCRGTISLATPSIAELLARRNTTGDDICTFALGARCGAAIWPPWEVQLSDKPKPPHVEPVLPEPSDTTTLKILQLSDPHVDLAYAAGSLADCDLPMCCHAALGPGTNGTAGPYGALAHCDIPMVTLERTLDWIVDHHPDIDLIYMTGDLPAHDIWNQTREGNQRSIRESLHLMKGRFADTPIFSSIGNHAPCFINIYPPESTISATNNISWLADTFKDVWPTMFSSDVSPGTIERGSYYSTRPIPGQLRVISINSNFCNSLNWWLVLDSVDPSGELQWLADQLQEAEDAGEKVHLLSHIPPGITDCLPVWSHQFNRIVNRYEDTIAAQFYGHTHKDEFEVFYDLEDAARAVGMAYIAPAATTYSFLNPAYRIYTVDTNITWMALDYDTYIMNLTQANSANDTSFHLLYSARADLLEAPPTPQNYDQLVQRMKTDTAKFDQYMDYFYHSAAAQADAGPCGPDCRRTRICAAETSDTSRPRC